MPSSMKHYRDWLDETADGLLQKCIKAKYDSRLCKRELEKLRELNDAETQRQWTLALEECWLKAADEWPELTPEQHDAYAWAAAEKRLITAGYCPPHWRYMCRCESCGWVALPEPQERTLASCAWCETPLGEVLREAAEA